MKRSKSKLRERKVMIDYQESANVVACTRRIERIMRRNLRAAARCHVNLEPQKRAQKLLTTIEAKSESAAPAAAQKSISMTAQALGVVSSNKVVRASSWQVLSSAINSFKNSIKAVGSFAKRKISFWRGSQWQVIRKEA